MENQKYEPYYPKTRLKCFNAHLCIENSLVSSLAALTHIQYVITTATTKQRRKSYSSPRCVLNNFKVYLKLKRSKVHTETLASLLDSGACSFTRWIVFGSYRKRGYTLSHAKFALYQGIIRPVVNPVTPFKMKLGTSGSPVPQEQCRSFLGLRNVSSAKVLPCN